MDERQKSLTVAFKILLMGGVKKTLKKRFVGLYIDCDIYEWYEREAKKRRTSLSQIVREAMLETMTNGASSKSNGGKKALAL